MEYRGFRINRPTKKNKLYEVPDFLEGFVSLESAKKAIDRFLFLNAVRFRLSYKQTGE